MFDDFSFESTKFPSYKIYFRLIMQKKLSYFPSLC